MTDPRTPGNAQQAMLLRTWPRTKASHTVTTAGTPITVDMTPYLGMTCFFKAVGGSLFGCVFQTPDTPPTLVDGEDFGLISGETQELYVWGDANLRLRLDANTDAAKLIVLYDGTP